MVAITESCDLCGLDIQGEPIRRDFDGEEKHFCCEGCARVYQIAQENDMLDEVTSKPEPKHQKMTDIVFNPGKTVHISVNGMWCAGCAEAAERVIRKQPGIKEADVNFASEQGRIQYDPHTVDLDKVLRDLDSLGYRARLVTDAEDERSEEQQVTLTLQLIASVAFGMQVMLLYLVQLYPLYAAGKFNDPEVRKIQYLVWLLATPVILFGGRSFLKGAWRALRAGTATMDTLVALGTLSAYSYSAYITLTGGGEVYFDSVAMITTFILFGRYLEKMGGAQARKDIRKLLQLRPDKATRRSQRGWEDVRAAALIPGDQILIKPGERVPADAEIQEGSAALDEALLTGESQPVDKGPGEMIYAGTVVTDDALVCRVLHASQATRLAQITQIVQQTLNTKPPIQRLADRASAYFAFGILGAAVITFLGWLLSGHPPSQALLAAVAVLVVACPCALGLATPLAFAITLGRTSQMGILVRNPKAMETVTQIDRVAFDKTGTLTRGQLQVVEAVPLSGAGIGKQEILCKAAAVEQYSEHPLAQAIVKACSGEIPPGADFKNLRGLGVSARLEEANPARIMVGSARFLGVNGGPGYHDQARQYASRGETIVWVGWGEKVFGFITLRDEPNATAVPALDQLARQGIRIVMLSGDSRDTTRVIAEELGIREYLGDISPGEKAERIQGWQRSGERVIMVGDGVNDAPALAQADLSITVAGGTDIAGETSDVVLTRSDLTLIPQFIQISRRTRGIIRENLGWAFAYNLITVPLAAFGIISPVIAAIAMATSSLLVVANSLRLR